MRTRSAAVSVTRIFATALAAAGLMASVAACGVSVTRSGSPAAPKPVRAVPPARDSGAGRQLRAQARAFARRMLAGVPVPPGAHALRPGQRPASLKAAALIGSSGRTISVTRYYRVAGTIAGVTRFLRAHAPRGTATPLAGVNGAHDLGEHLVTYSYTRMPGAVVANEVVESMVAGSQNATLLRIDAEAVPAIPRSAAEHIDPVSYRAVQVTLRRMLPSSGSVTKVFRSRSVVAELASRLNGMPTASGLIMSCPFFGQPYRLVFEPKSSKDERVVAVTAPCDSVDVRVGGARQPALQDSTGLTSLVSRLVGNGRDRPGHHLP